MNKKSIELLEFFMHVIGILNYHHNIQKPWNISLIMQKLPDQ